MNLRELESKLLAAARRHPPSDQVPYAFERRIMARLAGGIPIEPWAVWTRVWWRAAAPCLAITLVLGAWSFAAGGRIEHPPLDSDIESTVYAALGTTAEPW